MDAYDILRKQARAKRDHAIKAAHQECHETLRTIKGLRARVMNEPVRDLTRIAHETRGPKIIDVICQVMPLGVSFTAKQLEGWVQERLPGRELSRDTIRSLLQKLSTEGVVRRSERTGRNSLSWEYVKPRSCDLPFLAMLVPDASALVLGEAGPLRAMELVMALQVRSYRADASPKTLLAATTASLRRNPHRFHLLASRKWESLPLSNSQRR